ncbi:hypothetical protein [Streptomyces sp. S1D4-14]|uniref:hypothetical protein n=1 Tax=Streptomyces sp. S1D4-14 TaxID=2594461 RepID=UPI00116485AE|nr:hypothetical protein [Streptomyces sp. S1D4-14]QDN64466.1 hypothetical protein FNV66_01130 [Streptomyces sp. S1D4-14]
MFGSHQTAEALATFERALPAEATAEGREPVSRAAFLRVVSNELLELITYGPTYQRAVADNLRTALRMFKDGRGEEFAYWLDQTLDGAAALRGTRDAEHDAGETYVTATSWGVSYPFGGGKPGVTLNVYDWDDDVVNDMGGKGVLIRHPVHDGLWFADMAEAQGYALRYGLIKRYVREAAAA